MVEITNYFLARIRWRHSYLKRNKKTQQLACTKYFEL